MGDIGHVSTFHELIMFDQDVETCVNVGYVGPKYGLRCIA